MLDTREGRARDGGLRVGEMEQSVIVEYGASKNLRESLHFLSDKFAVHVCEICGLIGLANPKKKIYVCKICKKQQSIVKTPLPYSTKQVWYELMCMGLAPRLKFD
jgi:DNA-directed RNA polymerase II subunit RPB2